MGGGRNPSIDFRGEKRSRDAQESKVDPGALLYRRSEGTTAKLCYVARLLMESAGSAYDTKGFAEAMRQYHATRRSE